MIPSLPAVWAKNANDGLYILDNFHTNADIVVYQSSGYYFPGVRAREMRIYNHRTDIANYAWRTYRWKPAFRDIPANEYYADSTAVVFTPDVLTYLSYGILVGETATSAIMRSNYGGYGGLCDAVVDFAIPSKDYFVEMEILHTSMWTATVPLASLDTGSLNGYYDTFVGMYARIQELAGSGYGNDYIEVNISPVGAVTGDNTATVEIGGGWVDGSLVAFSPAVLDEATGQIAVPSDLVGMPTFNEEGLHLLTGNPLETMVRKIRLEIMDFKAKLFIHGTLVCEFDLDPTLTQGGYTGITSRIGGNYTPVGITAIRKFLVGKLDGFSAVPNDTRPAANYPDQFVNYWVEEGESYIRFTGEPGVDELVSFGPATVVKGVSIRDRISTYVDGIAYVGGTLNWQANGFHWSQYTPDTGDANYGLLYPGWQSPYLYAGVTQPSPEAIFVGFVQ